MPNEQVSLHKSQINPIKQPSRDNIKVMLNQGESYHNKFAAKIKEIAGSARSHTSHKNLGISSIHENGRSSRNINLSNTRLSQDKLNSNEINHAYGTQQIGNNDLPKSRDRKNGSFRQIKFSLDQINPIIRRLKNKRTLKNI